MTQARTIGPAPMPTLAEAAVPGATPISDAALVAGMALFIALCARISIPLPNTPVPITGTTLGVLYAGALLGTRRGMLSVGLYLILGAAGLPFFAGGASGWTHFFGATGGYLFGFLPAAWLTGQLARRGWDREPVWAFALMLLGSAVILACGLAGLSFYAPKGRLLAMGLYPFILGDVAKACLTAALLPWGWRLAGRLPRP